ncbi:MAG: hypothetical protein LAN37_00130 [Acidobacteriia bacterium]|nr:hypothetical protein [Terriglobia bacterium]
MSRLRDFWQSEKFRRFSLVVGSVVLAWALIELPAFLNILDYQALEFSGVWGNLRFIRMPDPELLHLERPYAHYSGSAAGGDFASKYDIPVSDRTLFRWDLQYDHNGFRNDTDLKSADIVAIGDSIVEGMTVPHSQMLTTRLASLEGKVVANLGQYGYGPQQELVVLKRYGLRLRPRIVIWMFFEGNDLADNIGYRKLMLHPPNFWNFFMQRSFTRFAYRTLTRLVSGPKPPGIRRSGVIRTPDGKNLRVYFTSAVEPLTPEELGAIDDTARIAASAATLSAAQGARFLFVFIPDKFRVFHDLCEFPPESECRQWAGNDLPERMRKAVTAVSPEIGYLDLTPSLVNIAKKGVLPYYPDDLHWTPDGHQAAAQAISDYVRSNIPGSPSTPIRSAQAAPTSR